VDELSHGNQQRVQLATALVHDPDILILDEPLSGLDPTGIDDIGAIIVERAREGRAVVFSSHQLDLVENLCDVVTIIDHGRVVAHGTVDELASAGQPRLTVRVEGDREGRWASTLPGVTVSEIHGGEVRLVLEDHVDTDLVLSTARAAGRVTEFSLHRRRLSEVFRESLS
jgi:ABC-2 type transport system ATP-binding protein